MLPKHNLIGIHSLPGLLVKDGPGTVYGMLAVGETDDSAFIVNVYDNTEATGTPKISLDTILKSTHFVPLEKLGGVIFETAIYVEFVSEYETDAFYIWYD